MKTYTKTIWNICACMLIILLGGCADDDIIRNDCGSTLQETESHLISTFSLPEGKTPIQDTREQIFFQLRSLSDNSIQLMEGKIRKNAGILSCEMFIPNNLVLEDGDYILWLKFDEEGSVYPLSYHLTFRDKMVSMVRDTKYIYEMLNGEGTEENPYLITSTNDFAYLVSQLATYDRNYGYGQFFKQIADIKAPIPNCLYQGNAYKSAPFAGNYDGDSHKILNLTYLGTNGGEQSDAIGLFSILHDGAVIRNLDIEGADIEYPGNCCGLLAGVANGNIRIENITLNGNIKSTKDKVGGLIGYIEGNAQSLAQISIRNVRLGVSFSESGSSYIGALIGWAENASIQVEDISSDGIFKNLRGNNHVAGLIGKLYGQIDARKIKLQHTTLNDFPISGNQNVGGLIGEAFLQAASSFKDITIDMPIKGSSYVGGLIGQIRSEAPTNILIAIDRRIIMLPVFVQVFHVFIFVLFTCGYKVAVIIQHQSVLGTLDRAAAVIIDVNGIVVIARQQTLVIGLFLQVPEHSRAIAFVISRSHVFRNIDSYNLVCNVVKILHLVCFCGNKQMDVCL